MWFDDFVRTPTLSAILTAAAIGFASLLFFFWILQHKRRRNSGILPPGPYPLPIIGNLHRLSLPAHRCLKDLADKYGPVMFLRLGSIPAVVVSSSEMAKQFLKTHDLVFANRRLTTTGKYLSYNFKGVILTPYGDYWRHVRKICVTELLSAKRIESFKDVREEEVSAMIRTIWKESESGTIAVNVSEAFFTLTTNIIWRILVRKKFSNNDLGANGKGFRDLVLEGGAAAGRFNIGDFIPYLDWLDLQGINRRMKKVNKIFDVFVEKVIDDHMDHQMDSTSNGQAEADAEAEHGKVFVDVLLQIQRDKTDAKITRESIKAIMLDMFGAGMESTAISIEWAMSELLRHPHAMKRLQEEIEFTVGKHRKVKASDVESLKYLHCVVRETLRLYPSGPLAIPHESVEAVTVGGYHIPKKTMLMVNVWAIGRDPNVWGKDASEFKPERFMEELSGHDDYTDLTSTQDFRMLPFGAGRRRCPGAPMAIPTISLALAQLLHIFNWRVEGDPSQLDMKEAHALTLPKAIPLSAFPSLRVPLSCL
jgi:cytochrome P450